jgi:hypothetical protein
MVCGNIIGLDFKAVCLGLFTKKHEQAFYCIIVQVLVVTQKLLEKQEAKLFFVRILYHTIGQ